MGILSKLSSLDQAPFPVNFNTGTLFDFMTGLINPSHDGHWLLNGGLGHSICGVTGKAGMFKSTICGGLMMRAMSIYPDSDGIIIDTEDALIRDKQRIFGFAKPYNVAEDRLEVLSGTQHEMNLGNTFKRIMEVCKVKEANKKDYIIETPFVDVATGKKIRTWIPTFVYIDSLTEMEGVAEDDMVEAEGIDGKKVKTVWMADGNNKTFFIRRMRKICERYGICLLCTAHVGGTVNMDSFGPPQKQLQHMKQGEKVKNVGSKFEFLTSLLSQTLTARILMDGNKKAYYPKGATPDKDINEITLCVQRCKGNVSGTMFPFVTSQTNGLLNSSTNYNYLRNCGYFGLVGSQSKHKLAMYPDGPSISRGMVRGLVEENYEAKRAIELTAQYLAIKNIWSELSCPVPLHRTPEQLYDELTKSSTKVEDILNSRGYWTYNKNEERKYMSIFDVVGLLDKDIKNIPFPPKDNTKKKKAA